ncbi:hypothetical protein FRC01_005946, partial [Tulasnella sp. 417]
AMTDKVPFARIQLEPQLILALGKGQKPFDLANLEHEIPQFCDLLAKCWSLQPDQRPKAVDCLSFVQSVLLSLPLPQQQPPLLQSATPSRVPYTQPDPSLQLSLQVNQDNQPGQPGRPILFPDFFTTAFNNWLAQRELKVDPICVDGKEVKLSSLFFMVGVFGGYKAVNEKKLWPVVGAKIGFPGFNGQPACSKPESADQLSEIYQKILAEFELHWQNSFRPRDPTSIFPLPPDLWYLHPSIKRFVMMQFPLGPQQQQQHSQRPLREGPPQQPVGDGRGPTPNQMSRHTMQMGQSQAFIQQQEASMRNQPGVASLPQFAASGQEGPVRGAGLANLPPLLQGLIVSPEFLKISPEGLKGSGVDDQIVSNIRACLMSQTPMPTNLYSFGFYRKDRKIDGLSPGEAPQLTPGNRPISGLRVYQQLGPHPGSHMPQPSALPAQPSGDQIPATATLLNGLGVSPEQFFKAREKVRATVRRLASKTRDYYYSPVNVTHDQEIWLERTIMRTQSLLAQVANNIVSLVILAPNNEEEFNRITQTVVTLADQFCILGQDAPERCWIFGLIDLHAYIIHLKQFMARVKDLQSQALQSRQNFFLLRDPLAPPKLGLPHPLQTKRPSEGPMPLTTPKVSLLDFYGNTQLKAEQQASKRSREQDFTSTDGPADLSGPSKRVKMDSDRFG